MDEEQSYIVKLSGLPFSASFEEIACFLAGLDIKGGRRSGIHITHDDQGRVSGECYVELTCQDDVSLALRKDREYIGERWISVTTATYTAMYQEMNREHEFKEKMNEKGEFVVKIRGLPWSATVDDVKEFFDGCTLKESAEQSVTLLRNFEGKLTGQGFVEFGDIASCDTALTKNRQHMGKRYLEVTRSDNLEMTRYNNKAAKAAESFSSRTKEPVVLCRGLPFSATEEEVIEFFSGLEVVYVQMMFDKDGVKPMGKCLVEFVSTEDSDTAIAKSGDKMGSRYIEVFQSNRKYMYSQPGAPDYGSPAPRYGGAPPGPPRGGARRPGPYSKPGIMGPRGRMIKPKGGYDGAEGYKDYPGFGTPPPPPRGAMGGKQKHIIIVKGVALTVSMGDLIKFFTGRQPPKNVEIKYGEAIVEFNTHADAMMEMLKDKTNLAGQKVNLELKSKPEDYEGYNEGGNAAAATATTEESYGGQGDQYTYSDPYEYQTFNSGSGYRWY